MKISRWRAVQCALIPLAALLLASPTRAQGGLEEDRAQDAQPVAQAPAQVLPQGPPISTTPAPVSVEAAPKPAPPMLRELSPWSMFLSADILVKAVMTCLAFASLVTWTILLAKSVQLFLARRRLRKALSRIEIAGTLSEAQLGAGRKNNPLSCLLTAAMQELRMSVESCANGGIQARAASRFTEILRAEARAARQGMGILATIGSTAPFVGLFGTVWGIMNSFIGISKAQTTNLAVVAPGIAEALLATAIGLAAAIPAVMIYNHFSRATKAYLELVGRAAGVIGRLLSRELDRGRGGVPSRRAE
jgi:biopolymer transport protein ExbB